MERPLAPEVKEAWLGRWEPMYRSQLHYLVTWTTRGRRPVLKERHGRHLRQLIRTTCEERGYSLIDVAVGTDHVHVLIGLKPTHSVATAVRELKGRTGMELLAEFPEIRVWLRGNLTWDEQYAVETVSAMRIEKVRDRLHTMHGAPEELRQAS